MTRHGRAGGTSPHTGALGSPCGTRPFRRAFLTSQPKWQGDLPELARPGTLFLGTASTGTDIGDRADGFLKPDERASFLSDSGETQTTGFVGGHAGLPSGHLCIPSRAGDRISF